MRTYLAKTSTVEPWGIVGGVYVINALGRKEARLIVERTMSSRESIESFKRVDNITEIGIQHHE